MHWLTQTKKLATDSGISRLRIVRISMLFMLRWHILGDFHQIQRILDMERLLVFLKPNILVADRAISTTLAMYRTTETLSSITFLSR